MSQTDYNVADQSGADFLVDINAHIDAMRSNSIGTSRPADIIQGQCWIKSDYAANRWGLYLYDGVDDILQATIQTNNNKYIAADANKLDNQSGAYYNDIPNGTRAVFYQSSAPVGYVQHTSANDRVLRVVSGNGGGWGGGWNITGLNVHGRTLGTGQMPRHNHGGGNHRHRLAYTNVDRSGASGTLHDQNGSGRFDDTTYSGNIISYQGSNNAHDHGISQNGNWRPKYIDVILCARSK